MHIFLIYSGVLVADFIGDNVFIYFFPLYHELFHIFLK